MTDHSLVCPKCGNKDMSMIENSETQTQKDNRTITLSELVCFVCSHVWSKRVSSTPNKQVNHGN